MDFRSSDFFLSFLLLIFPEQEIRTRCGNPTPPFLSVSTCAPLCIMAFYSYVMMINVHVGTEAILHVAIERHDRSMTRVRAARLSLLCACAGITLLNVPPVVKKHYAPPSDDE